MFCAVGQVTEIYTYDAAIQKVMVGLITWANRIAQLEEQVRVLQAAGAYQGRAKEYWGGYTWN